MVLILVFEEFKTILDTKRNTNTNYDGLSFELVRRCDPSKIFY